MPTQVTHYRVQTPLDVQRELGFTGMGSSNSIHVNHVPFLACFQRIKYIFTTNIMECSPNCFTATSEAFKQGHLSFSDFRTKILTHFDGVRHKEDICDTETDTTDLSWDRQWTQYQLQ